METIFKMLAALFIIAFLGFVSGKIPTHANVGHAIWVGGKEPREIADSWFESVGCCLDEIADAVRKDNEVRLSFSNPDRRALSIPVQAKNPITSFDRTLAPFLMGAYQLWFIDPSHGGTLPPPNVGPRAEDLSPVQAAAVMPFEYETARPRRDKVAGYRLVFTSRPRLVQASYAITPSLTQIGPASPSTEYVVRARPLDPLAVAEFRTDTGKLQPLLAGLELLAPTGIAFSPDNKRLYIVDERPSELVWHELQVDDFCNNKWIYRGVFARFALTPPKRSLFRGIWIHPSGKIFGSGPGGIYVYDRDGTKLGRIETPDEVTYVLPANDGKEDYLYAAIGERLCRLRLAAMAPSRPLLTLCSLPPPVPVRPPPMKRTPLCWCAAPSQPRSEPFKPQL